MGALAAGIAHEINNPTAYVLSNLGFLQGWRDELEQELTGRPQLPPRLLETLGEAKEAITECLEGARRIRDIVRDMRHFSHTSDLASSPVNIHAALVVVLRMAHGELKHTARLEKHYVQGPLFVLGNEGRLNQVFLNLHPEDGRGDSRGEPARPRHHLLAPPLRLFSGAGMAHLVVPCLTSITEFSCSHCNCQILRL